MSRKTDYECGYCFGSGKEEMLRMNRIEFIYERKTVKTGNIRTDKHVRKCTRWKDFGSREISCQCCNGWLKHLKIKEDRQW